MHLHPRWQARQQLPCVHVLLVTCKIVRSLQKVQHWLGGNSTSGHMTAQMAGMQIHLRYCFVRLDQLRALLAALYVKGCAKFVPNRPVPRSEGVQRLKDGVRLLRQVLPWSISMKETKSHVASAKMAAKSD